MVTFWSIVAAVVGFLLLYNYKKPGFFEEEEPMEGVKKRLGLILLIGGLAMLLGIFLTSSANRKSEAAQQAEAYLMKELELEQSDKLELIGIACRASTRSTCLSWDAGVEVNGEPVGTVVFSTDGARLERR